MVARDARVSTAAFNGNRAPPAGVIIDLLTVDEDAADVCDRLRDAPGGASVPILFIGTGAEGVRSTTDALIAGGDGFFQVPVEAARVTAKVVAYVGGPTPDLPMGLMVTVDEYDLLELTPEPLRIIVPRAALPGDLLGDDDDDDFGGGDPFTRGFDAAGDVGHDLGDTPAAGQVRPGRLGDADEFSSDFTDTTSPMTLRPATIVRAGLAPSTRVADDGDAAERLKQLGREATRLGAVVEAADAAAAEEEMALREARQRRVAAELELTRLTRERTVRIAEQEERIAALADERAQQEQAIAELDSARHADEQDGAASLQALAVVRASAEAALQASIDEHQRRHADEQRRLQSLADQRAAAEVALESLRTEQQQRLTNEEARLARLADDRADAEAAIRALADAERVLLADEAARLGAVSEQRIAAEAALHAVHDERDRRIADEVRRLHALAQQRTTVQEALDTLQLQHHQRVEEEEARLQALVDERTRMEQALASLQLEQQEHLQDALAVLKRLSAQRADVQADQQRLTDDVARRQLEQVAELEDLAARRLTLEAELQAIEADRQTRLAEQTAELELLAGRRAAAVADDEAQRRARDERRQQEEARLAALEVRRDVLNAEVLAATEAARARADDEEVRLQDLAERSARAQRAVDDAEAEHRQRLEHERARLLAIVDERDARQADIARLVDEEHARRHQTAAELAALAAERRALEEAVVALNARSVDEATQARATIAELESACQRVQDDLIALQQERARRERLTQEALEAANAHHDVAVAAHMARQDELARAVADEHGRLASLEAQRRDQESAAQAEEALRLEQLEAQEAHLRHVADQAATERARLADDTAIAEAALREREAAAAARLAAMAEEQQRLQEAARIDAERLARLRAEEEAARSSLQDARARARLSFVGGRFDAMPRGTVVSGLDVGAQPRAVGEGEGVPVGGPLIDVAVVEHEAPLPLPFRPLEPPAGRFDDGELPAVLLAAWSQRVTGKIELCTDDDRCRSIHLEDGEPVCFTSALTADRPEEQLLKGGLITAATHSELRVGEAISTRRLCSRLVDDGVVKLEELFSAVRGVLTEQLLRALEWRSGTFSYTEERAHAADRVRLEHAFDAVIAEGVRRKYDEGRLWAVLGGPATLLGPGDTTRCLPPLSSEERLAIERFDGTRCLDDVVLGAGLHGHVVLRAALIGVVAGALRVVARGLPRSADDVVDRRHRAIAIDRTRVLDKLALARHGDYFSFLGCESTATPFEVHRAAVRVRERFDPARYTDAAFADLKASLQEILDVVADAEAVLADPALKDAYRAHLRARVTAPSSLVGHGSRAS